MSLHVSQLFVFNPSMFWHLKNITCDWTHTYWRYASILCTCFNERKNCQHWFSPPAWQRIIFNFRICLRVLNEFPNKQRPFRYAALPRGSYVVGSKSFWPDQVFKVTEIKQLCYFSTYSPFISKHFSTDTLTSP